MNQKEKRLLSVLRNSNLSITQKLKALKEYIRSVKIQKGTQFLSLHQNEISPFTNDVHQWLLNSKLSKALIHFGIVTKNGFRKEIKNRFYNKFLPPPPQDGDLESLFTLLFDRTDDSQWAEKSNHAELMEFFSVLLNLQENSSALSNHLIQEVLLSIEILSIWIASEEFDEDFVRLDFGRLRRDSPFIALQREISVIIAEAQDGLNESSVLKINTDHSDVLIDQCMTQIVQLKKKSVNQGISISLTYKFERLEQLIGRLNTLLKLMKNYGTEEFSSNVLELFIQGIHGTLGKNSLSGVLNQNIKILALSVTNNASDHGEHYITENRTQYIKMLYSASGAGVLIAIMALIKITIMQWHLTQFLQSLFVSLNYGLGFVLIHMLGFTIATKQPAMTASTIASMIDKGSNNKADQSKLVELMFKVSRSQVAAVIGNVTMALSVAFIIGYLYSLSNGAILTPQKAIHYLSEISPYMAFFYASIAGFWLFVSGLIAGYFDNRANYLNLEQRYYYHPLLKRLLPDGWRMKFSAYLHKNHGAFAGNFLFGVLLGMTPFLGYIFEIPLDIRHIAFSSANLGYCAASIDMNLLDFIAFVGFVLTIGLVNLSVSFGLALKIALKAREAKFGSLHSFLKLFAKRMFKKPRDLFLPPKED